MTREEKAIRRDEMRAYKAEGHSFKDVEKKFGVSYGYAVQITKGIAPQKAKPGEWKNNQYTIIPVEDRGRRYAKKYAPGFEYAGNYTGSEGTIDLRCKTCGSVITRATITIRKGHFRCNVCYAAEMEKKRAEEKRRKTEERIAKKAAKDKVKKPVIVRARQETFSVCKECGAVFVPERSGVLYCSDTCRRKEANRKSSRRKDWRLKGKIVDRDIDLRDLARISGNVCALCGKAVDWNDYETRDNGVVVCGDYYPSIDHIVPLAHDGLHSWSNVQLAHRICNTMKGDSPRAAEIS